MEKIKKQLLSLGINNTEADTYLSILKLKNPTVTDISHDTGLKRTSIYYCIENLLEKGLISRSAKNIGKCYYPESPAESLNNLISMKSTVVESILPQLKDIYGTASRRPEIKLYQSIEGLRTLFLDMLNTKEKLARFYLHDYNVEKMLGQKFVDKFVSERIKKKITTRVMRPPEYQSAREANLSQIAQMREVKFIPKNLIVHPYIVIYDNKVSVISTPEERLGFIIESTEFALAQKNIFDYIWNTLDNT